HIKAKGRGCARIASPSMATPSPARRRTHSPSMMRAAESLSPIRSTVSSIWCRVRSISRRISEEERSPEAQSLSAMDDLLLDLASLAARPASVLPQGLPGDARSQPLARHRLLPTLEHPPADRTEDEGEDQRRQPDGDLQVHELLEQRGHPRVQGPQPEQERAQQQGGPDPYAHHALLEHRHLLAHLGLGEIDLLTDQVAALDGQLTEELRHGAGSGRRPRLEGAVPPAHGRVTVPPPAGPVLVSPGERIVRAH